jgi:hypothetical protein
MVLAVAVVPPHSVLVHPGLVAVIVAALMTDPVEGAVTVAVTVKIWEASAGIVAEPVTVLPENEQVAWAQLTAVTATLAGRVSVRDAVPATAPVFFMMITQVATAPTRYTLEPLLVAVRKGYPTAIAAIEGGDVTDAGVAAVVLPMTVAESLTVPALTSDCRTVYCAVQVIVCPGASGAGMAGVQVNAVARVWLRATPLSVVLPVFVATIWYEEATYAVSAAGLDAVSARIGPPTVIGGVIEQPALGAQVEGSVGEPLNVVAMVARLTADVPAAAALGVAVIQTVADETANAGPYDAQPNSPGFAPFQFPRSQPLAGASMAPV